jgi:hypothetical protein
MYWWCFSVSALVCSYCAFNGLPLSLPYRSHLEYIYDSGGYFLVDYHELPNPKLRLLFTMYFFATLFVISICYHYCCCNSSSSKYSSLNTCYVRTDIYSTLDDATKCRRPISSQIVKVNADSITQVSLKHTKSD